MTKDEALDLALEGLESVKWVEHDAQWARKINKYITAIKQVRSAPEQKRPQNCGTGFCSCIECVMEPALVLEPVATVQCINGVTIGYLDVMQPVGTKLYTTPPAAQEEIQRLRALVRAQQITIDKLEQALAAPVQETVAHCEAGPEHCQQCYLEGKNT